jgi:hypothetical protein
VVVFVEVDDVEVIVEEEVERLTVLPAPSTVVVCSSDLWEVELDEVEVDEDIEVGGKTITLDRTSFGAIWFRALTTSISAHSADEHVIVGETLAGY